MFDCMPQNVGAVAVELYSDNSIWEEKILLLSYRFGNHHYRMSICITTYRVITITKVTC